jgi:ABC-type Mn2+/Zn2+ transport system ATPase subunit
MLKTGMANGKTAPQTTETVLAVDGLKVVYDGEPAVEGVSFTVHARDRVAIIGPNGAGKSTVIKAIMGLLQPQAGRVDVNPARLGYVPQHEGVDWDFPVTVRDVVMMGRIRQIGWLRLPGRAHWRAVEAALERVGMADLAGRQIGDLSGGQRRRAFIARALAQQADILILDEPFSGVDVHAQASLMDVLESLNRDGMTVILSTHDLGLAFNRFDRVLAINTSVIADGSAQMVYTPEVLSQLYGGRLATWDDGKPVMVFVDDHHCET